MLSEASRALLDKLPVAIVLMHEHGVIAWANPRAVELLGIPLEKLLDRLVFDVVHPDDRQRTAERMGQLLGKEPTAPRRLRVLRDNGEIAHVEVQSASADVDGTEYVITVLRESPPGLPSN
jgi:PAS domain S-box-containing protein